MGEGQMLGWVLIGLFWFVPSLMIGVWNRNRGNTFFVAFLISFFFRRLSDFFCALNEEEPR